MARATADHPKLWFDRAQAPGQGDEGAPDAWLVLDGEFTDCIADPAPGAEIIVLTWLDRADRGIAVTRPRDDPASRAPARAG